MAGDTTDGQVIARSLEDAEAFAEIFERHYDAVFRFAERRVGWEAAREVASDVFVVAFRSRDRFSAEADSARPWLFGIASRKVLHEHRRFARHLSASARAWGDVSSADDTDRVAARLDADSKMNALRAALDSIDPESRELLLMVAWDGLSYGEAAAALALPIGTVRSRMHRARKALAAAAGLYDEENEVVG